MNQAASHPESRKKLQGAVQNGKLLQEEGREEWIVSGSDNLPGADRSG